MFGGLGLREKHMRRPLFGNGIPKRVLTTDSIVTVFDTNAFTPQDTAPPVFAVTLFAWGWTNVVPSNNQTTLPYLIATLKASSSAPDLAIAQRVPSDFAANESAGLSTVARPIKIVDRLMMRGDQVLKVFNFNPTCVSCWVYGYFEIVGETPVAAPFRPLQPGPLVAPFDASLAGVSVVPPGPANAFAPVHQLTTAYIDDVTLQTNEGSLAGLEDPAAVIVMRMPGNFGIPLPVGAAGTGHVLLNAEPFSGIPMRAPSNTDNLIEIGITFAGAGNVVVVGSGNFLRH